MDTRGRIASTEIDNKNVEITGSEKDAWVFSVLERAAPSELSYLDLESAEAWAKRGHLKVDLLLEKIGNDYGVRGSMKGQVVGLCARCGEGFPTKRDTAFRLYLHRNTKEDQHPDGPAEDPDYIFFSSDHIDLIDLMSEQLMVVEPMVEHCEACTGKEGVAISTADLPVKKSGQNPGQALETKATSPFSLLGDMWKKKVSE